jgi:hypothetical protein
VLRRAQAPMTAREIADALVADKDPQVTRKQAIDLQAAILGALRKAGRCNGGWGWRARPIAVERGRLIGGFSFVSAFSKTLVTDPQNPRSGACLRRRWNEALVSASRRQNLQQGRSGMRATAAWWLRQQEVRWPQTLKLTNVS